MPIVSDRSEVHYLNHSKKANDSGGEKMTIQDFLIEAKRATQDFFDSMEEDVSVKTVDTVKTNDRKLFGLSLTRADSMIGVTVYLDDLYDRLTEGEVMDQISEDIIARCAYSMVSSRPDFMWEAQSKEYYSLENVKNRLSVRLLDVRLNKCYMEQRPYIDVGNGLALIAYINETEEIYSEWKIAITNDLLDDMGCDKQTVMTEAIKNTMRIAPAAMFKISEALTESEPTNYLEIDSDDIQDEKTVYTITNEARFHGAAALYYPGVMKKAAEIIGSSYYVIPSSIHEVIVVPDSLGSIPAYLADALMEGNEKVVEKEDVLSEHIFYYDITDEELRIAA